MLKKLGCIMLILMLTLLFAVGCEKNSAQQQVNNEKNDQNAMNEQQNEATSVTGPVHGGVLKTVASSGPMVLGYFPEMSSTDESWTFPVFEKLLDVSAERVLEPRLAKSFAEDPENLTITINLREGVKFHDGSLLTADVVKWNYDMYFEKKALMFSESIDYIEVVDDYTVVFHLNDWHNQILPNWARAIIISKEAFEKNGIDWVRMNPVGTGPLKFEEFKRDVSLRFSRFEDYWQEDMPYLDGFEVVFVPDPEVAQAMLEAGEVHMWNGVPIKNQVELVEKGFVRQSGWAGMQYHLIPNTVDPNSPFADKRVREALEYAIDKEALAEVLGYGFFEPMYTVAVKGEWGGDREFRAYNPEKAKELLIEAGYTDGLEVSLLAAGSSGRNEAAEAIANYLNQVGFNVKLDIADFGRFLNASWKDGWEDLIITFTGNNMNQLMSFQRWWGHDPANNIVSFNRPEKLLELSKESLTKQTLEEQKAITEEMVYIIAEEALVVPLYNEPSAFVHNGKVHTTFFQKGLARWDFHDTWIEP